MVLPSEESDVKKHHTSENIPVIGALFCLTGELPSLEIKKSSKSIVIGRSSHCDYKINDSLISSRHCVISVEALVVDGIERCNVILTDTSSNGTYLNECRIKRDEKRLLVSGDHIKFTNNIQFIFKSTKDLESKYIVGKLLGSGHFAEVKEAINRETNSVVAIKIFHPNRRGSLNKELALELEVMMKVNHPNIVKFYDVYNQQVGIQDMRTCLVLEKVNGGELFNRIIKKGKLREDETKSLFRQLLKGLTYLHDRNIIHRDLKPENILLDIKPRASPSEVPTGPWDPEELDIQVKIADFGLAKFIGEVNFTNTLCGTPAYVAPEVLTKSRRYNKLVDLWSIGVLLYVCLCGFPPFSEELAPPSMKDQILNAKYGFYSPYWDPMSDASLDLISRLLIVDPVLRLDVRKACEHAWFKDSYSTGSSPMMIDDSKVSSMRISREETNPVMLAEKYGK